MTKKVQVSYAPDVNKMSASESAVLAMMKARMPVMMIGDPGIGKTATVRSWAKHFFDDAKVIIVIGSRLEPTDLTGFPRTEKEDFGGKDRIVTRYAMQSFQAEILKYLDENPGKNVILFLDEYLNSVPAVRASMASMIQDRIFPDGTLIPRDVIIVGATNPPDTGTDGYEIDLPTANRMGLTPFEPSTREWAEGFKANWGVEMTESEKEWRDAFYSFLQDRPGLIYKLPDPSANNLSPYGIAEHNGANLMRFSAFPSFRSWDNLAKVMGSFIQVSNYKDNEATFEEIARSIVGYEATKRLRKFLQEYSTFSPFDLVKNVEKYADNDEFFKNLSADEVSMISGVLEGIETLEMMKKFFIVYKIMKKYHSSLTGNWEIITANRIGKLSDTLSPADREEMVRSFTETVKFCKNMSQEQIKNGRLTSS